MELIRFVHIVGILGTFVFKDSQIIVWCLVATLPLAIYRANNWKAEVSRVAVALAFLGAAFTLVVKTWPSGLGAAAMLLSMSLIVLDGDVTRGPKIKMATAALVSLSAYAALALLLQIHSVDTVFLHSKNYLSVLGLVFYFAAFGEWLSSRQRPPLWLAIPALALCLLSLSIGGLVGAAGVVLVVLLQRFNVRLTLLAVAAGVLAAGVAVLVLPVSSYLEQVGQLIPRDSTSGVLYGGLADRILAVTRGEGGADRLQIWSSYIAGLDPASWWAGPPREELLTASLHNSYLNTHLHFGWLALVLLLAWGTMVCRARPPFVMWVLIALLAVRALWDSIFFTGGYFDGLLLLTLRSLEPCRADSSRIREANNAETTEESWPSTVDLDRAQQP